VQEGTDDQRIDRHPDRSAPVRVAAEHARVGFRRQIAHPVFLAARRKDIGMLGMVARQRPDAVGAQEFVLVEHPGQDASQSVLVDEPDDPPLRNPEMIRSGRMNRFTELWHTLPAGVDACGQSGHPLALRFIHGRGRTKRSAHASSVSFGINLIGRPLNGAIEMSSAGVIWHCANA